MTPIKRELQYRKYIRDAEGIKDKNCRHCKHCKYKQYLTVTLFCNIVEDTVKGNYLCDKFERGQDELYRVFTK
jgi:hypothetical protein